MTWASKLGLPESWILEDLPTGAIPVVEGDEGDRVDYIDHGLGIRTIRLPRTGWWLPGFLVQKPADSMVTFLAKQLDEGLPGGVGRILFQGQHMFMFVQDGLK
jgi:hypothetical protein